MTIEEMFRVHGEPYFREGEERVIRRLLQNGPQIVSTGGGAVISAQTRAAIAKGGVSIWLDAPLDLLLQRVSRRDNRPLLKTDDPRAVLERLIERARHSIMRKPICGMKAATRRMKLSSMKFWRCCRRISRRSAIRKMPEHATTGGVMTATALTRVDVKLGSRSYPILIGSGLLGSASEHLAKALPNTKFAIVADEAIEHTPARSKPGFPRAGFCSASRSSCRRAKARKASRSLSACAARFSNSASSAITRSSRLAAA